MPRASIRLSACLTIVAGGAAAATDASRQPQHTAMAARPGTNGDAAIPAIVTNLVPTPAAASALALNVTWFYPPLRRGRHAGCAGRRPAAES